jgi:hypothetical protein
MKKSVYDSRPLKSKFTNRPKIVPKFWKSRNQMVKIRKAYFFRQKYNFPRTKFREKTWPSGRPLQEKTLYTEEEFLNWCRDGDLLTYYSGEFDILVVNRTTALPVSAGLYSRLLPKDDGGDFDMEVVAVIRWVHCKKRLSFFPSLAGMSLTKPSLAGNYEIIPGQGEFAQWHPGQAGTGKR